MKKGISLIVLVITIIVMIILAAAVVISMSNNGIIDKASHAVTLTDEKQIQDLAALTWAEAYLDPDKRGDIENVVKQELTNKGVTTDKWNIEVTESGVTVTAKNQNENVPVEITDLTNTTWLINDASCDAGYGRYMVDYDLDYYEGYYTSMALFIGYSGNFGDTMEDSFSTPTANKIIEFSGAHQIVAGEKITFVGGVDVTNPTLIAWLKTHATKQ